jgi:hypothetical protein
MTAPTPPAPVPPHPEGASPARRSRLERLAPWVDLFFKLSAGLAASLAIWRTLL